MIRPYILGLATTGFLCLTHAQGQTSAAAAGTLAISEIMYHPAVPSDAETADGFEDADEFEYVELMNISAKPIDLDGVAFTDGIEFTIAGEFVLQPDHRCVLVKNRGAFQKRYGSEPRVAGNFEGGLKNSGEKLSLTGKDDEVIVSVSFKDKLPWPQGADGVGFSIVLKDPKADSSHSLAKNWQASNAIGGSPGKGDEISVAAGGVVVNEVLVHTDLPQVDAIELHNPTDKEINVSGWFLTDNFEEPKKYPIVPGSQISAGGYLVIEGDTDDIPSNNADLPANRYARAFSLSSHGEEVHLFAADGEGKLTGYSHGFSFKSAENGVSLGRHFNSAGKELFPPQKALTLGKANAGPVTPELVISEIHYHPFEDDEDAEFVEIWNRSKRSIPLFDPAIPANTWQLSGLGYTFPPGQTLDPNEVALISRVDPDTFRRRYKIPETVKVLGPLEGGLANKGERLTLLRPDAPDVTPEETFIPMLQVDSVNFNDKDPWPEDPDGTGASLERVPGAAFSDDPQSWKASSKDNGTPGAVPATTP